MAGYRYVPRNNETLQFFLLQSSYGMNWKALGLYNTVLLLLCNTLNGTYKKEGMKDDPISVVVNPEYGVRSEFTMNPKTLLSGAP